MEERFHAAIRHMSAAYVLNGLGGSYRRCIIKVAVVGYTAVMPGDGKRRRQVPAVTCFLRSGGGVVNGHGASADPLLECGAVFADVMQQSGGARFVSRAERCGKTRGEFARAAKVF